MINTLRNEFEASEIKRNVTLIATLGLKPFKDGNMWCFLYGENLQEGISGFGRTVTEASVNFEINFFNEEA